MARHDKSGDNGTRSGAEGTTGKRARDGATRSDAVAAALALARERPELGQFRAAEELRRRGITLSPSGVRAIWKRYGLETGFQRLSARGAAVKTPLSEAQRARLERARVSRRMFAKADSKGQSERAADVRRDHLLAVAARVFSAKGFDAASLREIAAAAGILAGSLYYHFRSKEDLFATVHAEGFRQLNAALDAALARKSDPWERLEAACTAHLDQLVHGNDIAVVTGTSLFRTARPALQRKLDRERDAYEDRFRRLIAALDLSPTVDRTLLRLMLLGALNWTRMWFKPGRQSTTEIARQWVREILQR